MRTQNLVVTAMLIGGAAACTGSGGDQSTASGTRADGVKVECTSTGADVAQCAPVDPADACDVVTVLWPPNHKMQSFTLDEDCMPAPGCGGEGGGGEGSGSGSGSGSGNGSGIGIIGRTLSSAAAPPVAKITSITVDELVDVNAGGDGHTASGGETGDVLIGTDGTSFELRSERQGGGDGRVYWVHWADDTGATGACRFDVPHDQGPAHGAIDSLPQVTALPRP